MAAHLVRKAVSSHHFIQFSQLLYEKRTLNFSYKYYGEYALLKVTQNCVKNTQNLCN
jgi:hypothetical protein